MEIRELRIYVRHHLFKEVKNFIRIIREISDFCSTVLNCFLTFNVGEIRVFSRNQKKQYDFVMIYKYIFLNILKKIAFYIGDVRDLTNVENAMHGVNYNFYTVALKYELPCEFFFIEPVKRNILGIEREQSKKILIHYSRNLLKQELLSYLLIYT